MHRTKIVTIDWRKPKDKHEKSCWGVTEDHGDLNKVFINDKTFGSTLAVETFFHEMTHVFFNFHRGRKVTRQAEERFADDIGRLAKGLLC